MLDHSDHYTIITKCITDGTVVPFLGAGANLCGRPPGATWGTGTYLPSGRELAEILAKNPPFPLGHVKLRCPTPGCKEDLEFNCPKCGKVKALEEAQDLLRIAQYVTNKVGSGNLYGNLREVFDANYPLTPLHQFLAALPAALETKGCREPGQRGLLVVTTNYDDLMERAFQEARQPFDVVTYAALGKHRGRFLHCPFQGEPVSQGKPVLIEDPDNYGDLLEQRPVILKIHGAVNRSDWEKDSYVIAEDDYIDYLAHFDIHKVLPKSLLSKLKASHLLFLGYSLSDWNLRVVLHRIWSEQELVFKSWAIQVNPQAIEENIWHARNVDIFDVHLEDYVIELQERIANLRQRHPQPERKLA